MTALEAFDNGFGWPSMAGDFSLSIETIRYSAYWADQIHAKIIEVSPTPLAPSVTHVKFTLKQSLSSYRKRLSRR